MPNIQLPAYWMEDDYLDPLRVKRYDEHAANRQYVGPTPRWKSPHTCEPRWKDRAARDLRAILSSEERPRLEGVVLRVNEQGLGIIKDTHSQEQFAFTFDKIRNYRGEKARELGLTVGAHVRFTATADHQVISVELIKP